MSKSDVDVAKRVVINKEARKIVIQRKQIVSPKLLIEEKSDDKTKELLQEPVEKKAKLSFSEVQSNSSEASAAAAAQAPVSVQNKLSALERLKSLNFSAPKSAVNPFSLVPTKSNSSLDVHHHVEEKSKKQTDVRPVTPLLKQNFSDRSISISDDKKPKSLLNIETAVVCPPQTNVRQQFIPRPPRFSTPQRQENNRFCRPEFRKQQNFNEFSPRPGHSPPICGETGVNFNARFPRPPPYPDQNYSTFTARNVYSPPVFKPEDIWINPILPVQKDHLEREKLESLQITECDINSLSAVGLKNAIEYLLEIENELICQSAHLVAQIK